MMPVAPPARRGDLVVTRHHARLAGRILPCTIGRAGIGPPDLKQEGDGITPAGAHRIMGVMYRPDRIARGLLPHGARPIGPRDLWSDDATDPDYNNLVRAPHHFSHEMLRRADPQYDLVLITDWNWPKARPGAGSAIFVHVHRGPHHPTAGCVAFRRADLLWVVHHLDVHSRLIVRAD